MQRHTTLSESEESNIEIYGGKDILCVNIKSYSDGPSDITPFDCLNQSHFSTKITFEDLSENIKNIYNDYDESIKKVID